MAVNLSEIVNIVERFNVNTVVIGDQRCVFVTRDKQQIRKHDSVRSRVVRWAFVKGVSSSNRALHVVYCETIVQLHFRVDQKSHLFYSEKIGTNSSHGQFHVL